MSLPTDMSVKSLLTGRGTRATRQTWTRSKVRLKRLTRFAHANSVFSGPSPIRQISDFGPVKGSSNPDLMCGLTAQKAALVVPANPGSVMSFQWVGGDGVSKVCVFVFRIMHAF